MKISGTVAKKEPDQITIAEIKDIHAEKNKDIEQGNVIKQVKQSDISTVHGRVPIDFKTATSMFIIYIIMLVAFLPPTIQSVAMLFLFCSLLWVLDAFATLRDFEKLHDAKYAKYKMDMKKKEELESQIVEQCV